MFTAIQTILSAPTRFENKRSIYVISGVLGSLIYYLMAVGLVWTGYNYFGMMYAKLISGGLLLLFFIFLNRRYFRLGFIDKKAAKELLKVGLPLMPTFLIYWIFHSMDKVMITNMIGLAQVGIYSVGAKVASISQLIYTAFAGGWQYFAFSTMKDKDQVELNSRVMEYLGAISFVALMLSSMFDDYIFKILFDGDYIKGVIVFPYLFLSPLLLMLFQVGANQFLIYKKSYLSTICLLLGAVANLTLNYVLIRIHGIKGASLATLIGYAISVTVMLVITVKKKWMKVYPRFIAASLLTFIVIIKLYLYDDKWSSLYAVIGISIITLMYKSKLSDIIKSIKFLKKKI
jgi:O-antigen/teichoic acid export membrane protein